MLPSLVVRHSCSFWAGLRRVLFTGAAFFLLLVLVVRSVSMSVCVSVSICSGQHDGGACVFG